jgi:hypothetical protein
VLNSYAENHEHNQKQKDIAWIDDCFCALRSASASGYLARITDTVTSPARLAEVTAWLCVASKDYEGEREYAKRNY